MIADGIESDRLILEPLQEQHAAELFEELSDNLLYTFIPVDPPQSVDVLAEIYERRSAPRPPERPEIWLNWVGRDKVSHKAVGLFEITILLNGTAKLSYTVLRRDWLKGYAREACSSVITYVSGAYGVVDFISEIDTRNIASIGLVKSLGFKCIDTVENADFFRGQNSDEYVYWLRVTAAN